MERNEFWVLFSIAAFVTFTGCTATLQSYKPETPDEATIKDLLVRWESTWNKQDINGLLNLWNEQARIMYGRERQIASKKEYAGILPDRMKANPFISTGAPSIKVSENRADAKVNMTVGSQQVSAVFRLVKDPSGWTIMNWEY